MQNVKTHPLPTNSDLPGSFTVWSSAGNSQHLTPSAQLHTSDLIQLIIPPSQTSHHTLADRSFHTHPESPPGLAPRRPHLTARCKRPSPAVSHVVPATLGSGSWRPTCATSLASGWALRRAIPFHSMLPSRWSEWSYCLLGCLTRPGRGGIRDVRRFPTWEWKGLVSRRGESEE
jgi:hypothetical protein